MAAIIEVKYFNTFLLKKVNDYERDSQPVWDGSRGIPQAIGGYPRTSSVGSDGDDWAIEESRIRGGYNNVQVSQGVKAYLVENEPSTFGDVDYVSKFINKDKNPQWIVYPWEEWWAI